MTSSHRGPARPHPSVDSDFVAIMDECLDMVYSSLLRLTASTAAAADLAQEALVAALISYRSMTPAARKSLATRPWLYRIALNRWHNAARHRRRHPEAGEVPSSTVDAATGPEDHTLRRAEMRELGRLLATIPVSMREALVLRYVAELTYEEMAAATGEPVGTLRARVSRGLTALRNAVSQQESIATQGVPR